MLIPPIFNSIYLIFCYGLLFTQYICDASHSSIELKDGYKGIVIAFSPELEPTNAHELITKTKELIQNASNVLHETTEKRAYFKEITFVVPNSWTDISGHSLEDANETRYNEADIIITNKISNARSFTIQYAGCGKHALPIVLSEDLVLGTGDGDYGNSSKLLVHEWAHYRYGVFNEFGFPNDPLYPLYYTIPGSDKNDIQVNSCSDTQSLNVYAKDALTGGDCSMVTNNETGLPLNEMCIPLPDMNNTMKSSFMYSQALNSVTKFCGSETDHKLHNHNINSPNKQNVLCNGRDTWSVIKTNLDSQNIVNQTKVNFKVWRDSKVSPRTLIAVASSELMNSLQRNIWINMALTKFTKIDLPKSQVSLITFNGETIEPTNPSWNDAVQPIGVNFVGKPNATNFRLVLQKGKQLFSNLNGGSFVIIIGGIGIDKSNTIEQIESVAKELRSMNIKLKIIVYPVFEDINDRKYATTLFKKVISITGGSVVYIREDKILQKSSVSTLAQLINAFESVKADYSGSAIHPFYTIGQQVFNDPKISINFTFNVDSTILSQQLWVYLIQSKGDFSGSVVDSNSLKLKDPNGDTSYIPKAFPGLGIVMLGFNESSAKTGEWQMTAAIKSGNEYESVIAIAQFESNPSNRDSITAKCWLSSDAEHDPSQPLLVYVQVNEGINQLIQEVSVKYNLTFENGVFRESNLIDDGLGDPDITKGDGIYSQYIVDIRSGYYDITATISDNNGKYKSAKDFGSTSLPYTKHSAKSCCGQKIDDESSSEMKFNRVVNCGSVFVTNNWQTENYPPNTIRDLRVEKVDYNNRTVYLLWTSPGGDYTFNQANKYVIKAFHGNDNDPDLRKNIKNNFDSQSMAYVDILYTFPAQKYGEEQRTRIKVLSDEGGMYYFAIKSFDKESHGSDVSNIVVAYIKSNVQITSTTALTNEVSKAPVEGNGGILNSASMEWWEILAISIACVVVLIFIIIIAICFVGKNRRKNQEENQRLEQPPQRRAPDPPRISPPLLKEQSIHLENGSLTHSVEKIPNMNTINRMNTNNSYSGSQPSLRELNVNALSPVQSWDAKDLLSHWGRVQEAKQRQETPPVMRIEDIESASSNHSPSYASSEDENTATYTSPDTWRYQDVTARPAYIPNSYPEPAFRSSLDPMRTNSPSDSGPRYSSVIRKPTTTVSQV